MIDVTKIQDKVILIADKNEIVKHLEEKLSEKIVDEVTCRHTSYMYDNFGKIQHQILEAVVTKAVEKILAEKYQEIYAKIDLNTVANMAAVNIAKGVAK